MLLWTKIITTSQPRSTSVHPIFFTSGVTVNMIPKTSLNFFSVK
uniref:Uncharacterized protein n=1 Tax=Lepeophtheirus salmonis TaxID=72036 RepID=A0A0K2UQ26_LEPSM